MNYILYGYFQCCLKWEHGEDRYNDNHVTDSMIKTTGNECVDIKERSSGSMIQFNECSK